MKNEQIVPMYGVKDYYCTNTGKIIGKQGYQLVGGLVGGYYRHNVKVNNKIKSISAARAIWESFHGPIPAGMEIDHINGNKTDNRLENLRVVTHKENMNNPVTIAKMHKPKKRYTVKYEQC